VKSKDYIMLHLCTVYEIMTEYPASCRLSDNSLFYGDIFRTKLIS
jgi:hypothetical protein